MKGTNLAHEFSNLLREVRKRHVGKGPEQVTTRFVGPWAICELRGNLTLVEKFINRSPEGKRMIKDTRTTFIKEIYQDPDLRAEFENLVGAKMVTLFVDFDVDLDMGMTVYVFDRPIEVHEPQNKP
ncbi:DUF2294 domain-containing protein [Sulfoacidibacillus thermotolerans]|uniref:Na+-translocating membrane potential-generating system MpsC domain-containing protein n=1 Tax=Sulfoacidibacillus thermotolerans TaxID=1765684 RepID=A0A2U3DBB2_SULT2|nr:DUF2294 domain-containing protein [Sulfoacidibacillus thermotolerans]PWI58564.1 hypothetical protein BM613_03360 [Sulfoacidibacillus thermotolerans]